MTETMTHFTESPLAERADAEPRPAYTGTSIVVPAYNEEDGIEGVVRRLGGLAFDQGDLEILVVNDGSTDGTRAALERLEGEFSALRVIDKARNEGYGAALLTGFAAAKHDVVVITDADGTYPEDRIGELVEIVKGGADMAIGSRTGSEVHIPLIRRPAKAFLRKLASFLAEYPIPDLNSGLRAFRRDFVLTYRAILPKGFSFTTTITLAALTNHHPIEYLPIDYAARKGRSKIRPIRDTLGFLALIVKTVLYFNPLKVFYPLTWFVGLGFAASLGYDLFYESPPNLGDKTVLLFVATMQILTMGLVADLICKRARL
ncbi:MAG: glycosyltransferase family 2 protein [Planctomycetes bacterium]|nr:glycosyltransferase family 2 protein [Planctomycetota bacterium]